MITKHFNLVCLLVSLVLSAAHAAIYSDEQLLGIGKKAFTKWGASKNAGEMIQILRDEFAPLDDAQRTRALVFWLYDLDANGKPGIRGRHPLPASSIEHAMREDPSLVSDPSELKHMMAGEKNGRKFYIMCFLADHFMRKHKADFVREISHMLHEHGPVAATEWGEMINPACGDASYIAYNAITNNLELMESNFVPPDKNLPYDARIPILVKWLKTNWPGCKELEDPGSPSSRIDRKTNAPQARPNKGTTTGNDAKGSAAATSKNPKEMPKALPVAMIAAALAVMVSLVWYFAKARSRWGK